MLNNWKKFIAKAGVSQNGLADSIGYNRAFMSQVCNGYMFMPLEELKKATDILHCKPEDLYSEDVVRVFYGDGSEPKKTAKQETVCVRIKKELSDAMDTLVDEGYYESRNRAINVAVQLFLRDSGVSV